MGVSVEGGLCLCPGGSLSIGSLSSGGICPQGSLSRGSLYGDPPESEKWVVDIIRILL